MMEFAIITKKFRDIAAYKLALNKNGSDCRSDLTESLIQVLIQSVLLSEVMSSTVLSILTSIIQSSVLPMLGIPEMDKCGCQMLHRNSSDVDRATAEEWLKRALAAFRSLKIDQDILEEYWRKMMSIGRPLGGSSTSINLIDEARNGECFSDDRLAHHLSLALLRQTERNASKEKPKP